MRNRQLLSSVILSSLLTVTIIAGSLLIFGQVAAAPPSEPVGVETKQVANQKSYVSVSGLFFGPTRQSADRMGRLLDEQLLIIQDQSRDSTGPENFFLGAFDFSRCQPTNRYNRFWSR